MRLLLLLAVVLVPCGCGGDAPSPERAAFDAAVARCRVALTDLRNGVEVAKASEEYLAGIASLEAMPQDREFALADGGSTGPATVIPVLNDGLVDSLLALMDRHADDPGRHDAVAAVLARCAGSIDLRREWAARKAEPVPDQGPTVAGLERARERAEAARRLAEEPELLARAVVVRFAEAPDDEDVHDPTGLAEGKRRLRTGLIERLDQELGDIAVFAGPEVPDGIAVEPGAELVITVTVEGAEYRLRRGAAPRLDGPDIVRIPEHVGVALIGSTTHFAEGLIVGVREQAPDEIADEDALLRTARERTARFFAAIAAKLTDKELLDDPEGLAAALETAEDPD